MEDFQQRCDEFLAFFEDLRRISSSRIIFSPATEDCLLSVHDDVFKYTRWGLAPDSISHHLLSRPPVHRQSFPAAAIIQEQCQIVGLFYLCDTLRSLEPRSSSTVDFLLRFEQETAELGVTRGSSVETLDWLLMNYQMGRIYHDSRYGRPERSWLVVRLLSIVKLFETATRKIIKSMLLGFLVTHSDTGGIHRLMGYSSDKMRQEILERLSSGDVGTEFARADEEP